MGAKCEVGTDAKTVGWNSRAACACTGIFLAESVKIRENARFAKTGTDIWPCDHATHIFARYNYTEI